MAIHGAKVKHISFETDRMQFIGRGNSVANPRVMTETTDPLGELSGSQGSVLDPIVAIRSRLSLWGYAISGDLPIVLLRIEDPANIDLVRQLVQAHLYWRLKGLQDTIRNESLPSFKKLTGTSTYEFYKKRFTNTMRKNYELIIPRSRLAAAALKADFFIRKTARSIIRKN